MSRLLHTRYDQLATPIGVLGVAIVAAFNWRQWQQDKALLNATSHPEPLLPLEMWPKLPLVSVLVAAWNESSHIERHIESFLALRYPNKQLVLCAGGLDDTLQRALRYTGPQITVLEQQPGEGKHTALLRAFPHTCGDVIFLTDADCLLSDDAFEHTIWPIATAAAVVATGGSKPLPQQQDHLFVRSQWAPLYWAERKNHSTETPGLLGRNTAVQRAALAHAWADVAEVSTGTDYYLALQLRKNGYVLHRVPHSAVATHFPTARSRYVQQQSRWLKNLLRWGVAFGDWPRVQQALLTMALGFLFLALALLLPLLGAIALALNFIMLTHAFLARLRYLHFLQTDANLTPTRVPAAEALIVTLLQWWAAAKAVVDLTTRTSRNRW